MLTQDTDKKLFLLDAYALIYRSYFAFSKNPRINSKGMNTSAVMGFTNTLNDVLKNEKPTHIAVVFDPPGGPTNRTDDYVEYKANRQETPEDIKMSIPYIKEICKGFGIPTVEAQGYEADDVIGTLAKQAEDEGYTVYMMTPDKDFAQLVSEHIFMYRPGRMGNPAQIWGVPEVQERFQVKDVLQVIDILGLWGDSVDNIPGVPGVGEKTAKKMIADYGSMEKIYENIEDFKGKRKENLVEFKEQAEMCKMLATILIDAPVGFDAGEYVISPLNHEILKPVFAELEFRQLSKRILGEELTPDAQPDLFSALQEEGSDRNDETAEFKTLEDIEVDYKTVESDADLKDLAGRLKQTKAFCFDTETTSVNAHEAELVGIAFSYAKHEGYYVPVPENEEERQKILEVLMPVFQEEKLKIAHNIKYDLNVLRHHGVEVKGAFFDTMVAHYLIDPENNRRSMDVLAEQYLQYTPKPISELIGKKGKNQKSMREVPVDEASRYACEDADVTYQLYELFEKQLKETQTDTIFYDLEMPLVEVLSVMECEGIRLDKSKLGDLSESLAGEIEEIEKKVYEVAGEKFNIGSPKQVGEILFDKLQISDKPKKTKSGQYATNEEALNAVKGNHEIVRLILEYRELLKLKNTYVDPLPELINSKTGRIHTNFNQVRAATGRLSSDKPNLQNIPIRTERGRFIRKAFVPRDDNHQLLAADYSQVELRVIAALAEEENMIADFKAGKDIHAATAARVYGVKEDEVTRELRGNAKTVNFGIIYGISAFGLSQRIDISRGEAKEIIDNYFEQYPAIKKYMDAQIAFAREHGYVETIKGRRRYLRDINSKNATVRGFAERNAINSPIQGSAADIIKIAMINIFEAMKKEKFKSKMLLQVHDELIFDVAAGEEKKLMELVKKEMSGAVQLDVPLDVDAQLGADWLEAH